MSLSNSETGSAVSRTGGRLYPRPVDREAKTQRGWVSTDSLSDLASVSRDFLGRYGVRVTSYTIVRQSKGGLTQIDAVVAPPTIWWRWFGRRPPVSKTALRRSE